RLLDAGAIVIGTTGCDEFAMGSSNESSYYGPVYNPLDPTRVPGGSSGGSAAAVAAKTCHAALGSDTGGSIRQPAAFCGIVGVKPTYGRISRYGLIAFGSSLDQIGPMTQTVADARLLLATMAGADPLDSTSADRPVPQAGEAKKGPYKIGVLKETLTSKGIDPRLKSQMEARIAQLRQAGHTVDLVDFPYLDYVVPTYYILATAEASSNLARFDGVRYGYRSPNAKSLEEVYLKSRSEGFGPEVQRRIMLGTFVLSSGYLDAYYTKAQKVRRLLANYTQSMLAQYDALLSPTTPTAAFALDSSHQRDPISLYLSDIYTVHANLTGNPAVSVPHGTDENGLPYGVQLMGGNWQESTILHMAETLFIPL
ncbi:MAG: amidase family protein, partial [Sphingobacteriia bacterium]